MTKAVFRRRPFWWRLALLGLVTAVLLYALNAPMHISMELPASGGIHYAQAPVHADPSAANPMIGAIEVVANTLILAIAGAIAWIMLHFERKAQAKLRDAFQ
jgi:hypothetical protein